ncbi:type II secretion system protein [Candidatus Saccharibacteria bacterium]|nr:type II secretion system protein [Candidatus Saccharibacteria bacterium]
MKKMKKKGFTIIEVALFLALSGAIFAMIMSGTASRIAKRRYTDAVNDLAEDLRNAYSAAINVENYRVKTEDSSFFCSITSAFSGSSIQINSSTITTGAGKTDNYPGRTRCAYYGQVITFGEDNNTTVHHYDIIGLAKTDNLEPEGKDDVLLALSDGTSSDGSLAGIKANIVTIRNEDSNAIKCSASTAGNNSSYLPQWDAKIENKENRNLYRGAIMIARSPISGTIHTYLYTYSGDTTKDNPSSDKTFFVQEWLKNTPKKDCKTFSADAGRFVKYAIDTNKWKKTTASGGEAHMDICVGSDDLFAVGNKRRAIRIHGDGSTEAAIEVMTETDSVGICKEI